MSKLDSLYKNYRRYCDEIGNRQKGSVLTFIELYQDGSGMVVTKIFLPTESNPFNVVTQEVCRFKSPYDGAKQLEELLDDGQKVISQSSRRVDSRLLEAV